MHSEILLMTVAVLMWSMNRTAGVLGNGNFNTQPAPGQISSSLTFTQVACGFTHTCAVATGGLAFCWGEAFATLPSAYDYAGMHRSFRTLCVLEPWLTEPC